MEPDKNSVPENADPGFDTSKYVSMDEYLRDVTALKNLRVKVPAFVSIGAAVGSFNIWLIRFMEVDSTFDWLLAQPGAAAFAMDQILAWLAAIFVLMIPGIWIGVSKHKYYAFAYFSGFSAAGIVFMAMPGYLVPGLYAFLVSFLLLVIVYLVFFKIWAGMKRSVARMQVE
ncbi:MAG: hypothetical protein JW839_17755 [Candidatus Lokiarchaeota archaeon]|nr:hypothetical protein [Candidatus Lokiarchaeota archaeon]